MIRIVLMTRFLLVIVKDLCGFNVLLRVSLLLDSGQGRLRWFKFFPSIVEVWRLVSMLMDVLWSCSVVRSQRLLFSSSPAIWEIVSTLMLLLIAPRILISQPLRITIRTRGIWVFLVMMGVHVVVDLPRLLLLLNLKLQFLSRLFKISGVSKTQFVEVSELCMLVFQVTDDLLLPQDFWISHWFWQLGAKILKNMIFLLFRERIDHHKHIFQEIVSIFNAFDSIVQKFIWSRLVSNQFILIFRMERGSWQPHCEWLGWLWRLALNELLKIRHHAWVDVVEIFGVFHEIFNLKIILRLISHFFLRTNLEVNASRRLCLFLGRAAGALRNAFCCHFELFWLNS